MWKNSYSNMKTGCTEPLLSLIHILLVVVHGGPTSAAFATPSDSLYYPYEQFMERGFIILDVNYRGSSGYGEKFRKLNYRNLGLGDYQDVITGVDMLVEQGLADTGRVEMCIRDRYMGLQNSGGFPFEPAFRPARNMVGHQPGPVCPPFGSRAALPAR